MAAPTTVEQLTTELAKVEGALKNEITALRGDVQTLTAELRLDRETRAQAEAIHDAKHADYERRLRFLERAVWIAAGAGTILGGGAGALLGS